MNRRATLRVHGVVDGLVTAADDMTRPVPFEEFFVAHRDPLHRALFVLTRDGEEARDISQDAFAAVWERWDRVSRLEDPAGYLFRTALNRYRSRLRRARVAARSVLVGPRAAGETERADDRVDVARALAALPSRQREAIVLTELLGYDSAHAAQIMGVASATVRRLVQNARQQLSRSLGVEDG